MDTMTVAPVATLAEASEASDATAVAATQAKADHAARCAAGRVRKLMSETRDARAHVATARSVACNGLEGDERKEASSEFSASRREAISLVLDGMSVRGLCQHVKNTKAGQRVTFTATTVVNDGTGNVTLCVKGELTIRDSVHNANGALFTVTLKRKRSTDKLGNVHYSYHVSQRGDAGYTNGTGTMFAQGTLTASEFVRVAVNVAARMETAKGD